ncbi:hypothetical protein Prudu_006879 [Prunus dulcis]|uniref:Uncharacterized protein n=1 Tax=Prunus dulcis TaxID=3755 RepID=A0A4Y1R0P7_PRUDU|nr:hypothetical protein Prudu_006879 [Prunus dulcis]
MGIHSYDFSFSLSSGSLWLVSQPPCGRTSQPIEHETSLQSMVFQLAAHPPFPASDKGWGKELGQVLNYEDK